MAKLEADLLLVTVTTVETKAVLQAFRDATGQEASTIAIGRKTYHDLGVVNETRVVLVRSEPGAVGLGAAQQTIQKGIEAISPTAVIMVGIAFGVSEEKQSVGDVLISKQLVPYEAQRLGKKKDEPQVIPRGPRADCSPWLLDRCRSAELHWEESAVRVGLVLSGEKLVDDLSFRKQLVQQEPEAIGGEMEGAGLYAACQDAKVDWVLIKAICDWADGEKAKDKKRRQALAAQNAAAFVLELLDVAPLTAEDRPEGLLIPRFDRVGISVAAPIAVGGDFHATAYIGSTSDTPLPYSSIPTQPYFFGREEELKKVTGAIHPEARTWGALIDGPGGIGKTALAIQAAHDAPTEHFDRKIFLSAKIRDLTATGEVPLKDFMLPNYLALLTELARELGEDQISRTPENERASAVRRTLADRRALIVVDNLETFPEPERIRLYQFLQRLPPGCKAIVTSRRRSDIDARVVRLDRLKEREAFQLLAALAERNRLLAEATDGERRSLYEATGGNPLLLRWTVGQLGQRKSRCRTVTDAISFLHTAPPDNDPLEYVFGDLLDTFTENETVVLGALTHFTLPARAAWIADLACISEAQAQAVLEDLTDRALVASDPTEETFILTRLAVTFLRRKRPEVVAQTGDRLDNQAYTLALNNGYEEYDCFSTLDAQWPIVAAALPRFVDAGHAGANERLQQMCDALDVFLDFSGRWDDLLRLHEQAEGIALAAKDFNNAGWRAYQAAWLYNLRKEPDEVLVWADRAETHWQKAEAGTREQAIVEQLRGAGYKIKENYPASLMAYRKAFNLIRELDPESEDVAVALNDIAGIERRSGNLEASEQNYREALQLAKKIDCQSSIVTSYGNLALIALDRKKWLEAEQIAREALEKAEDVGRQEAIGNICMILAIALVRQGRAEEALSYAQRAVAILSQLRLYDIHSAQAALRECEEAVAGAESGE